MAQNSIHVQPPLEFVPPNMNPTVVRAAGAIVPLLLTNQHSITKVDAVHVERLVRLYEEFQSGKARFLIAFRHPSAVDPLCIQYLLSRSVPQFAQHEGIALKRPTHTYFLYDRGVPLWAGAVVGWMLPRVGGISLQRGKLDRAALRAARDKFANGDQPMMAAPEGATNGLNEIVSSLEPGVAQMAFWCLEDLREKGRTEKVYIVPLGIRYRYISPPWESIDTMLGQLLGDCGLPVSEAADRYTRLTQVAEYLLSLLESYYSRFYQQNITGGGEIGARLRSLMEAALRTAEQFFAIQPKGSVVDRCRRIEQAGWDRIYREDLKGKTLSPVERGLADRVAEEADRRMWHMRIVESFVAVSGSYVHENPSGDRYAETVGLLSSTVARLKGENANHPLPAGRRQVELKIGEPMLIDERFAAYAANRAGARQAVAELTQTLQHTLENMIHDDNVSIKEKAASLVTGS